MFSLLAKSYTYENGKCYIDGVLQATTNECTSAAKWILGIGAAIIIPILLVALVLLVFWVIMLVHAIRHEDLKDRNMWLLAMILGFIFGFSGLVAIVYYFAAKRPYDKNIKPVKPKN